MNYFIIVISENSLTWKYVGLILTQKPNEPYVYDTVNEASKSIYEETQRHGTIMIKHSSSPDTTTAELVEIKKK